MRDSMTVTHSQHIGYRCVHAFAYTFNAHNGLLFRKMCPNNFSNSKPFN